MLRYSDTKQKKVNKLTTNDIFVNRLSFLVFLDGNNVKLKNRKLLELKPQGERRQLKIATINSEDRVT